jgi:hypothetical protein
MRTTPKILSEVEIEGVKYFVVRVDRVGDSIDLRLSDAKHYLMSHHIYAQLDDNGEPMTIAQIEMRVSKK